MCNLFSELCVKYISERKRDNHIRIVNLSKVIVALFGISGMTDEKVASLTMTACEDDFKR